MPLAKKESQGGTKIGVMGNPLGDSMLMSYSSGTVSGQRDDIGKIQINGPITHGFSGGPVCNNHGEIIGIDTGFQCLNKICQGFQPGQLIILAARPAMGKSAMAMNLAVNVATHNNNGNASVAIFNLEMSAEQLVERMIA